MCTFNVLCVAYFKEFLTQIMELRKVYKPIHPTGHHQRINFDTPYLKEPPHWMINILPPEWISYMDDTLQFMNDNELSSERWWGFNDVEIEKFKRVTDYMRENPVNIDIINNGRRDFYTFFTEYDQRRNVNLLETFPAYEEFYYMCKSIHEDYK